MPMTIGDEVAFDMSGLNATILLASFSQMSLASGCFVILKIRKQLRCAYDHALSLPIGQPLPEGE